MGLSSFIFSQVLERSSSQYNKNIEVIEEFGQRVLRVNGIQETGPYVNSLFRSGLRYFSSWHKKNIKSIALFGVGGGGILFQLERLFPGALITAIDYDSEVIELGKKYFNFDRLIHTTFVIADARKFVTNPKNGHAFDLVVIDLYVGNDVPEFVTSKIFLNNIKKILAPRGAVVMNYFSFKNQQKMSKLLLDKLSKIYQSVVSRPNKRNIFFFCH